MIGLTKTTKPTSANDVKRDWHEVDVNGQVVGRIATRIATYLMGKSKPYFTRSLDCGDYVVVVNAKNVVVTGRKSKQKMYTQYSGYPGGLRKESFTELKNRKPEEIIKRAVVGMLPKNKLRDTMLKRLYVFTDSEHPYKSKFKTDKS